MKRLEALACRAGASEEAFMSEAGKKIAEVALKRRPKRVLLLVGTGNNGGDAYAAGLCLLEKGVDVKAVTVAPLAQCSLLNQKFGERFRKKKGKIGSIDLIEADLILDGFLGTGFRGKPESKMATCIEKANRSGVPIVSIDIPSGVDGSTGEVRGVAIAANETVAMGFLKSGFFLREGWNRVGKISLIDFGLPQKIADQADLFASLLNRSSLRTLLPPVLRKRHKYEAGYVVGLSGSSQFRGAPKLAGLAALRAGAGIVRIFHEEEIGEAPYELICEPWEKKRWQAELKRATALFIGPGMGASTERVRFLKGLLGSVSLPLVVDADALQKEVEYPKKAILTPHRGEMLRLLGLAEDRLEEDLLARCQKFADRKDLMIVLKGAPTWVFAKDRPAVIVPFGDPGMATAGSGDVLTGILAALLAQKTEPFEAALLGAALHGMAGEEAAQEKTSYGLIASDLIEYLPQSFARLRE